MIDLKSIERLSTREGKKLDYTKLANTVKPQLEKQRIVALTTQEVRELLGISQEYKNAGAYYHTCRKIAENLNVKTVVNRKVQTEGKTVRVIFFSDLEKKEMFSKLEKLIK